MKDTPTQTYLQLQIWIYDMFFYLMFVLNYSLFNYRAFVLRTVICLLMIIYNHQVCVYLN